MRPAAAIVQRADVFAVKRCRCPICLQLDALHPGEGFQLGLFAYRPAVAPPRRWP